MRPLPRRDAQLVAALLHDACRLAHLLHANEIAVVAIAVLADGNVEVHFLIAFVGLRFAQVPRRARAAHHHAGESPRPALGERDDADVDVALLEDAVAGEQRLEIVADFEERIAEIVDVVDELRRQILVDAARPEIGRVHARPARPLVEHHQLLALLEAPERRGERAHRPPLPRPLGAMRAEPADLPVDTPEQPAPAPARAARPTPRP